MYMNLKKKIAVLVLIGGVSFFSPNEMCLAASGDLDEIIQTQENLLTSLNKKRTEQQETLTKIVGIERQIDDLQGKIGRLNNFDSEGAISAITTQISNLQEQLSMQNEIQKQLLDEIKAMKEKQEVTVQNIEYSEYKSPTSQYLVNPGPSTNVGFTQDAVNAQGNSTMVFSYAPNQLYKVYCKVGYLTDLAFKKGEKITFVGGGDTATWMIDSSEVDNTPHLYLKPINLNATTNLIINTNKRSYQVIAVASEWYNPMVTWSYSSEEQLANKLQAVADEKIYTGTLNISSPEQLNFDYKIEGNQNWKPTMVFDDGRKTYIKFNQMSNKMPVLFIKEANRKEVSLVNYNVKDNYYIVDKIFTEAQLKVSDKDTIKIKKK